MDELTDINPLQALTEKIERLCLENEILGLMLQVYWTEKRDWRGALHESANEEALRNPVHKVFAGLASASLADVPPECLAIFESLSSAIQQTREEALDRVEKHKEAL